MKTIRWITLLTAVLMLPARAFDPAGPPPEKTMAWTVNSISNLVIPSVDFDGSTVEDAVQFLGIERPRNYRVTIDTSKLGPLGKHQLTFKDRNARLITILGRIAHEIGADLLISPGTVTFVPRQVRQPD